MAGLLSYFLPRQHTSLRRSLLICCLAAIVSLPVDLADTAATNRRAGQNKEVAGQRDNSMRAQSGIAQAAFAGFARRDAEGRMNFGFVMLESPVFNAVIQILEAPFGKA